MPRLAHKIGTAILALVCLPSQLQGEPWQSTESIRPLVTTNGLSLDWNSHERLARDYLDSLSELGQLLSDSRLGARPTLGENLVIDPWSTTLPSVPRITFTNLNYANGNSTLTPVPSNASHAIPQIYHVAQHLGLGTNNIHLEVTRIDGKLFTSIGYGFHLSHRLRYDLVGTFRHHDSETNVETFRQTIESKGRTRTRRVDIGADVKPHKINLHYDALDHETLRIHTDRPWNTEALHQQFPDEFRSITSKPAVEALEKALQARLVEQTREVLADFREQQIKKQLAALENLARWPRLETSLASIREWETNHHHNHHCKLPNWSSLLVDRHQIEESVQNQRGTITPWELNESQRQDIQRKLVSALLHGLIHRLSGPAKILALEELVRLLAECDQQ